MQKKYGIFGLALALALGACGDSTGTQGSGKISISLTDAPSDSVTAAVVTVTDIYLQSGADSTSTSGRVYLRQGAKTTVNLLNLRDSLASLVNVATVPVGTYQQLRFVITGAYIQTKTSTGGTAIYASSTNYEGLPAGATVTGTLQLPSWASSGLKVIVPGGGLTISDGATTNLVADFDLASSLTHPAGQGKWVMSPVIKATTANTTASLTVNVGLAAGVTLPTGVALTGFQVQMTDANGNSRTAALNAQGSVTFQYLLTTNGPFTISVIAPTGHTATVTVPSAFTLNAGANTQVATITAIS